MRAKRNGGRSYDLKIVSTRTELGRAGVLRFISTALARETPKIGESASLSPAL